jgi:hypothetical protein
MQLLLKALMLLGAAADHLANPLMLLPAAAAG